MHRGFIKLWRKISESNLWLQEKFTRGQAWIDLIMLANHKPGYIRIRGIKVEIDRGQLAYSELTLAERWKWSRGKVRRFLKELEANPVQQIVQQKNNLTTLISIINYEQYQGTVQQTEHQAVQQTDTKRYTNKNDKNDKNKNIYKESAQKIIAYLNNKTGKKFSDISFITARLNEGKTVEQCKTIIDNQIKDPYFIENPKYMNPQTLFRPSHWDKYLNNIKLEPKKVYVDV